MRRAEEVEAPGAEIAVFAAVRSFVAGADERSLQGETHFEDVVFR